MRTRVAILLLLIAALPPAHARGPLANWNLHALLQQASLVVIGIPSNDNNGRLAEFQCLPVEATTLLPVPSGTATAPLHDLREKNAATLPTTPHGSHELLVLSRVMTTGNASGPWIAAMPYLLFLTPVSDATWELVHAAHPDAQRQRTFELVGNWEGAICLNPSYADLANHAIRRQYGITDPLLILATVRQAIAFLQDAETPETLNPIMSEFTRQATASGN